MTSGLPAPISIAPISTTMSPPDKKTSFYTLSDNGIKINVQVQTRASCCQIVGLLGNYLKLRITASAIDGQANLALCKFLANTLDVPKSSVSITHGQFLPRKVIFIKGNPQILLNKLIGKLYWQI